MKKRGSRLTCKRNIRIQYSNIDIQSNEKDNELEYYEAFHNTQPRL